MAVRKFPEFFDTIAAEIWGLNGLECPIAVQQTTWDDPPAKNGAFCSLLGNAPPKPCLRFYRFPIL
jgi:hypothetical protein